ncbi:MAG: cytochrome C oxidase subunit IV family protein [Acidobacteria bacterium]|nr:cytochrome C oxidase subunit IV family protein [Acidobacteriota bacterium]
MADVRGYVVIFGTLLALTLVTVGVANLSLPMGPTVALGLTIATAKATLVVMFFMHLKGERPMVLWPLALTAFLFVALFVFLLLSEADHVVLTTYHGAAEAAHYVSYGA